MSWSLPLRRAKLQREVDAVAFESLKVSLVSALCFDCSWHPWLLCGNDLVPLYSLLLVL